MEDVETKEKQLLQELEQLTKEAEQQEQKASDARRAVYDKAAEIFRLRTHEMKPV